MHENGQTQAAYDSLIAMESQSPDDRIRSSLTKLGRALKKSHDDVENDIWRVRKNSSRRRLLLSWVCIHPIKKWLYQIIREK